MRRLHPAMLAATIVFAIAGAAVTASAADAPATQPGFLGRLSQWQGFDRYDFTVDDCATIVVVPKQAAAGRPWVWNAEFFGHRPNVDVALLGRGFHVVYMTVGNTFGCPSAMAHWAVLYKQLTTQYGFSRRPAFEALSRGGLYAFNWSAAHSDAVSCIYADAPVLDFKSWPGGKGAGKGSPKDWAKLIKDYGFADEAEALAYTKNPVDNLAPLAKARIPLLHVCGDADVDVPITENTLLAKERYEKLGGTMELIVKKGGAHHPHGLDDPTPIVEFMVKHATTKPAN